ncbi:MAG TPA: hypothetical protein VLC98_12545 [Phnomibacter sp.]|nr:hypothetical protein [Phnomibacter sp.]
MQKIGIVLAFIVMSHMVIAQSFSTYTDSVYDKARNRTIPYKVYRPQTMEGTYPVIIFSHGLGGNRNAAAYLGAYLSSHGYICFHIQHAGSDESLWRGLPPAQIKQALLASIQNPANMRNRFEDIPFMLKAIATMNATDTRLKGHLNLNAIGMAGHSYGAISTMVACGQKMAGTITKYAVPEIKAGLVLSPSKPLNTAKDLRDIYTEIKVPLFHITGTNDEDPIGSRKGFDPASRQEPYQNISTSPQYLLVLDGATHASFGGNEARMQGGNNNQRYTDAVSAGALAFFDSYLKNNTAQKNWLQQEYKNSLLTSDKFAYKN